MPVTVISSRVIGRTGSQAVACVAWHLLALRAVQQPEAGRTRAAITEVTEVVLPILRTGLRSTKAGVIVRELGEGHDRIRRRDFDARS